MKLAILLCVFVVCVPACSSEGSSDGRAEAETSPQTKNVTLSFEDDVSLVVLTEVLNRYGPGKAAFVSIKGSNPSSGLMIELQKQWPSLRPVSESYLDKRGDSVKDKQTNADGVRFQISEIRRLDETTAEVSGGYYTSNLGADGCKYHLKYQDGDWSISEKTDCWVS